LGYINYKPALKGRQSEKQH